MTELYSVELQQRGEEYIRRRKVLIICLAVAAVVLNIVSCLLSTDDKYIYFLIFNIVVDVAAFWTVYFVADCHIRPERAELNLGDDAMGARKLTVTGRVESFAERAESAHSILCYKLCIVDANGEETFCHLSQRRFTGGFAKGDVITAVCYGNTVVAFRKEEQA